MNWKNFRLSTRLNLEGPVIEQVYELITAVDSVKNSWQITKKLLPQTIERLTHSVIVTSSGASNRIEGNRLTDKEVEDLYKNLRVKKFKNRDEQEIAGYLEMLKLIFHDYTDIPISKSSILHINNQMLLYSEKDLYHRGKYKASSNRVEAKDQNGKVVGIIFDPTPPYLVRKEVQELIDWYHWSLNNKFKHPLIIVANFVFEYLAIHPFQDGNGRTSRLMTNLMLLQQGYDFVSIVSHEKIIETNKLDCYLALNKTQSSWKSGKEDISLWLIFFLNVLKTQANEAHYILERENTEYLLSRKQLFFWEWALSLADKEFSRKDAIEALGFPPRTVEAITKKLLGMKYLQRLGEGKATRYKVII
ncbi:Fic family protein [Wolbachia endosymbiont (group A) of Brachyopa scutellaris]|uniref:Fic family protein n=1 Tax=Wolbachia endosymbiont (group A) of Brachyopa scutellaris TaxID=3066140 RepID=UPI003132BCF6